MGLVLCFSRKISQFERGREKNVRNFFLRIYFILVKVCVYLIKKNEGCLFSFILHSKP